MSWTSSQRAELGLKISLLIKDNIECSFWCREIQSCMHYKIGFSNFPCMFLNLDIFFPKWILIVLIYHTWKTSRNKLEKNSVNKKNCSDLSLFQQIVLVISNFLQILGL